MNICKDSFKHPGKARTREHTKQDRCYTLEVTMKRMKLCYTKAIHESHTCEQHSSMP